MATGLPRLPRRETDRWIGYAAQPYHETSMVRKHGGLFAALKTYERWTRFSGIVMLLAFLLAFAGPFVGRRRPRTIGALLAAFALVLMATPPATIFWDARLALPVYGVLAAAAAVGSFPFWASIRRRDETRSRTSR
jgi:hypothetical protein